MKGDVFMRTKAKYCATTLELCLLQISYLSMHIFSVYKSHNTITPLDSRFICVLSQLAHWDCVCMKDESTQVSTSVRAAESTFNNALWEVVAPKSGRHLKCLLEKINILKNSSITHICSSMTI